MLDEVLSVTELREFVTQTLSYAYPLVVVEGEVASFRVNQGKWIFFDIKDSETTLSCFMTKYQLKTVLEDGMLVRISATPNLTKWGKFSLTVKDVELAGAGEVQKAFELMKARFEAEGLFEIGRKRALPTYPMKVALITSTDAAAYNDFLTIARDRWPLAKIEHVHTHVQGLQAPLDIVKAIRGINAHHKDIEVIVVVRGGGSAEDLQAFHHEDVVRAVYASHIPVVVGIGHEDDVSLAELAADVRASTPTDAARRVFPDQKEVRAELTRAQSRMHAALLALLQRSRQVMLRYEKGQTRFFLSITHRLERSQRFLQQAFTDKMRAWSHRVVLARTVLNGVDPTRVLARGYAIVRQQGVVMRDPEQLRPDSPVLVQLQQGSTELFVKEMTDEQRIQTNLEFS